MFAVYASEPNPDEPLKSLTVGDRPEHDGPVLDLSHQHAPSHP